jgi:ABC-type phosphate/phosphonate transport system substrate-binding protein
MGLRVPLRSSWDAREWKEALMGVLSIRGRGALITLLVSVLMLTTAAGASDDVGTEDNPVRLSVASGGEVNLLANALFDATGLYFDVEEPAFGEAAIGWLCEPGFGSLRIMASQEYVFADCSTSTRLHLTRFGSDSYFTAFFVPDDSVFGTLDDLVGVDGLEWYHPAEDSVSGYIVPKYMLAMAGIEYSDFVLVGNHPAVVEKMYERVGSEDPVFGTAFFDARTMVDESVAAGVRLLAQSPAIPNNPVVFGPDFPANVRRQIEKALVKIADPDSPDYADWQAAIAEDAGLDKLKKKEFDFLRSVLEAADIGIADI